VQDVIAWKKDIRQQMTARRQALTASQVTSYSADIIARVQELEPVSGAQRIMAFASIGNEVDLLPVLEQWRREGVPYFCPEWKKTASWRLSNGRAGIISSPVRSEYVSP
jgi:5-formyltetrahydrofolate cyclo-ligase